MADQGTPKLWTPKLLPKAPILSAFQRKAMTVAFVFMLTFIPCMLFILFDPSAYSSSFIKIVGNFKYPSFVSSNESSIPHLVPKNASSDSNSSAHLPMSHNSSSTLGNNVSSFGMQNSNLSIPHLVPKNASSDSNSSTHLPMSHNSSSTLGNNASSVGMQNSNITQDVSPPIANPTKSSANNTNQDKNAKLGNAFNSNQSHSSTAKGSSKNESSTSVTQNSDKGKALPSKSQSSPTKGNYRVQNRKKQGNDLYESMLHCNIFDGKWVKDDSYPLYAPGSCPHIDEPFNCFLNGRPDNAYEKYRWQPHGCNIPRLNGTHMLQLLRGKRLVFVGDSLNRNMWESLVCTLRNSVEDKSRVFEASGRIEFRTESSYSFIFKDYNCSVEFFGTPFLVQEWEMPDNNGSKKETLRLDLVEMSSDKYKDADILIFNTGHWWTHEKTTKGQGFYQEGSHVHSELNANEAFRRAMTTWGRWLDFNVNPTKTQVFFRGYSASHFGGGKWNSGGRCDMETEPFKNDTYLESYPPFMEILEDVMKWMRTPVFYLNITRLSDYRKDAHPAIYRAQQLTEEERRSPLRYQDCSHWCLPGVPETWNELMYAQILVRYYQKHKHDQQLQKGRGERT